MRVTHSMLIDRFMSNLHHNLQRLEDSYQQLSTGKRLSRPSDDPAGTTRVLRNYSSLARISQHHRNAGDGAKWMETADRALDNAVQVVHRGRELAIYAGSGILAPSDLEALAQEVDELADELRSIANSELAGSYLFGGNFIQERPFDHHGNYLGTDQSRLVEIAPGITIPYSITGSEALGETRALGEGRLARLEWDLGQWDQAPALQPGDPLDVTFRVGHREWQFTFTADAAGEVPAADIAAAVNTHPQARDHLQASVGAAPDQEVLTVTARASGQDFDLRLAAAGQEITGPGGRVWHSSAGPDSLDWPQVGALSGASASKNVKQVRLNQNYPLADGSYRLETGVADADRDALVTVTGEYSDQGRYRPGAHTLVHPDAGLALSDGQDRNGSLTFRAAPDGAGSFDLHYQGLVWDPGSGSWEELEGTLTDLVWDGGDQAVDIQVGPYLFAADQFLLGDAAEVQEGDVFVLDVEAELQQDDQWVRVYRDDELQAAFSRPPGEWQGREHELRFHQVDPHRGQAGEARLTAGFDHDFVAEEAAWTARVRGGYSNDLGVLHRLAAAARGQSHEKPTDLLEDFDQVLDRLLHHRAEAGARTRRLDMAVGRMEGDQISLQEIVSELEDVDVAEAVMRLKARENVYLASLNTGSRILQPSLIDFLR